MIFFGMQVKIVKLPCCVLIVFIKHYLFVLPNLLSVTVNYMCHLNTRLTCYELFLYQSK